MQGFVFVDQERFGLQICAVKIRAKHNFVYIKFMLLLVSTTAPLPFCHAHTRACRRGDAAQNPGRYREHSQIL